MTSVIPLLRMVRAKIITMAADRILNHDIAARLELSRPTAQLFSHFSTITFSALCLLWRDRYL